MLLQDSASQIEELLDKLSISLTGEELDVIGKLYQQAMKLEVDFFYAQRKIYRSVVPLVQFLNPKSKLVIFSDFDLTCTTVDSSAILAEIAILTAQKADLAAGGSVKSSVEARAFWNDLSTLYTEEYEQCIEKLLPSEEGLLFCSQHEENFKKKNWYLFYLVLTPFFNSFFFCGFQQKDFSLKVFVKD
jgi:thiamine phosphate phosphatase / amino-HMP aminohydrolase